MHVLHTPFLVVAAILAGVEAFRTRSFGWGGVAFLAAALCF